MNDQTPIEAPDDVIAYLQARPPEVQRAVLCNAIAGCNERDAATIMAEALAGMETIGPEPGDLFGRVKSDAAWWAETAPQHEVQTYVHEGMKRLGASALGRTTRISLMATLWNGLSAQDKAAFLDRVDGPT